MSPNKLRDTLLLRLLAPMCVILLVSGAFSYWLALRYTYTSKDRALAEDARALVQQIQVIDETVELNLPRAAIEMFEWDGADREFFQVSTEKEGVISGDADIPLPQPEIKVAALPVDQPYFYDGKIKKEDVRIVAFREPGATRDDVVTVLVATTVNRRKELTKNLVAAVVLPQLALVLFTVLAIRSGVGLGLAPLDELAEQIGKRRRDDMVPLELNKVPEEVRPLIHAFNELLARLGEAAAVQQRFIADAAHQLRTPLAALKAQIDWVSKESDAAAREAALQQLAASVNRTARLSNQLLLLARAEPNGRIARERTDLRALAFEIGSQWVARALQGGRDLGFAGSEAPVWVCADRVMVSELINNLLDNAMRYGGPHITLRVDGDSAASQAVLSVEDNGAGIPPQEEEQVFERFHRVPGSPGEGSGLGLAIVREIARGHDAEVALEQPAEGGIRVAIRFPLIA